MIDTKNHLENIYEQEDAQFEALLLDMLRRRFTDTESITIEDIYKLLTEKIAKSLFNFARDNVITIKFK
jgi:hypothetical protein